MAVRFQILGTVEAYRDGVVVDLGSRKQRALIALLLTRANQTVSRDQMVDALWEQDPPATAVKTLQVFVSRLRKQLGKDAWILTTQGSGYAIDIGPDQLDALQFERLLEEGDCALREQDHARAESLFADAIALWHGDPLSGLEDEPFVRGETPRLEELRLRALEGKLQSTLELGRHTEAVGELQSLCERFPLREHLRALSMLALYRCGRQAEALDVYQRGLRLLRDELGIEPGDELQALQRQILNQAPELQPESHEPAPSNLPLPPTPLVGRGADLETLQQLLDREHVRLVTLTGTGGTGKTRLALEIASARSGSYRDGVFFVDLSTVEDPELIAAAIAQALSFERSPGQELGPALRQHLDGKRALLVLDNLEQISGADTQISELLSACQRIQLLATSRSALRIRAEQEFPLDPLSLPREEASLEEAARSEAVALFVARAEAINPRFLLDEEAVHICRRLDGLPLALELAAARIRAFTTTALRKSLDDQMRMADDRFIPFDDVFADLPRRQRTIGTAIDWSYSLLDEHEQRLFWRLGVFAGSCSLADAEAVCADEETGGVLGILSSLVDKSLLQPRSGTDGESRFAMLQTLRAYALGCLRASGEEESIRRRHAERYVAAFAELVEHLSGSGQETASERFEAERGNARDAIFFALEKGDADLALSLAAAIVDFDNFVGVSSPEERDWVDRALGLAEGRSDSLLLRVMHGQALMAFLAGDTDAARLRAEQTLEIARSSEDGGRMVGSALNTLAALATEEEHYERAEPLYIQALEEFQTTGFERGALAARMNLAAIALYQRDFDKAEAAFREGLEVQRRAGDGFGVSQTLGNLAMVALHQDKLEEAQQLLREAREPLTTHRLRAGGVYLLEIAAAIGVRAGDVERAARLLGAAGAIGAELGVHLETFEQQMHDRAEETARVELGEGRFAELQQEGRDLEIERALEIAFADHAAYTPAGG